MFVFLKAQAASITATAMDFLVAFVLVRFFGVWYVLGTACGTIVGGIVHFSMGRHWVFGAADGKVSHQALKYFLVWVVYLLLSTGLVYLITNYGAVPFMVSKALVAVLMSVGYNFFLHKKFVFK